MPGINSELQTEFFRILRIAFVKPVGKPQVGLPIIYPFTYQTFAPELLRCKDPSSIPGSGSGGGNGSGAGTPCQGEELCRMERMKETFAKGLAHLRTTGNACFKYRNDVFR